MLCRERSFRVTSQKCDASHSLRVVGSNPTPATKFLRVIIRLRAALRGGVCVSSAVGSTAEARRAEVLHIKAKTWTVSLCNSSRSAERDGGVACRDRSYADGRNASVSGTLLRKALVGPMGSKVQFARRSGHLSERLGCLIRALSSHSMGRLGRRGRAESGHPPRRSWTSAQKSSRLNFFDPYAWLVDTLSRITAYRMTKVEELLPWRWNR